MPSAGQLISPGAVFKRCPEIRCEAAHTLKAQGEYMGGWGGPLEGGGEGVVIYFNDDRTRK